MKNVGKFSCIKSQYITNHKLHDDVIKWNYFPRYWPFVRGIHRSSLNSPHKGQWRWALMFLWSAPWINGWVNNREAGDLRRRRDPYDVIVIGCIILGMYERRCIPHIRHKTAHIADTKTNDFVTPLTTLIKSVRHSLCWPPSLVWI